jgi:hypothetical protein
MIAMAHLMMSFLSLITIMMFRNHFDIQQQPSCVAMTCLYVLCEMDAY